MPGPNHERCGAREKCGACAYLEGFSAPWSPRTARRSRANRARGQSLCSRGLRRTTRVRASSVLPSLAGVEDNLMMQGRARSSPMGMGWSCAAAIRSTKYRQFNHTFILLAQPAGERSAVRWIGPTGMNGGRYTRTSRLRAVIWGRRVPGWRTNTALAGGTTAPATAGAAHWHSGGVGSKGPRLADCASNPSFVRSPGRSSLTVCAGMVCQWRRVTQCVSRAWQNCNELNVTMRDRKDQAVLHVYASRHARSAPPSGRVLTGPLTSCHSDTSRERVSLSPTDRRRRHCRHRASHTKFVGGCQSSSVAKGFPLPRVQGRACALHIDVCDWRDTCAQRSTDSVVQWITACCLARASCILTDNPDPRSPERLEQRHTDWNRLERLLSQDRRRRGVYVLAGRPGRIRTLDCLQRSTGSRCGARGLVPAISVQPSS